MRQLVAAEERHAWRGERGKAVEKRLQCGLTAEGIAEQDGDEVDHLIVACPTASKADMLRNSVKDAALSEMASQQDQFSKPGWDGRNVLRTGVNLHKRCSNGGHMQLLRRQSGNLLHRSIVEQ